MPIVGNTSLFSLKVFAVYLGEIVLNRFWYQTGVVPDTIPAADLIAAFEAEVSVPWQNAVAISWIGTTIEADEVTSIQNFADLPATVGPGVKGGDNMGPNIAMAIRLFRSTKETRSGWKRIAGLVEPDQISGLLTPAQDVLLQLLADTFQNPLTVLAQALYPVIVRRTYTGDPPVLEPASNWIYNVIANAAAQNKVTTQNTRKYGR